MCLFDNDRYKKSDNVCLPFSQMCTKPSKGRVDVASSLKNMGPQLEVPQVNLLAV